MILPIIGVTCCFDNNQGRLWLSENYINAVLNAGGIPVILPVLAPGYQITPMLDMCNGLLLPGGGDIDPLLFGEEPLPANGEICPQRDSFEIEITKQALAKGVPILGICRGAQVLNVAAGGTVCQDIKGIIANPLKHSQEAPRWYPTHTVVPVAGTLFESIVGSEPIRVNSYHHQMVGHLGSDLIVSAFSLDNVVEAIEYRDNKKFVLGVQYHPEGMWKTDQKANALFKRFIDAATAYKNSKKVDNDRKT